MVGVGFKRIDNKGNKQMSFKDISKESITKLNGDGAGWHAVA